MTDVETKAFRYLTPAEGAFWQWSSHGEVVEWTDGGTIAFRSEVAAVLARLAPHGLPALDLVILLLAACRNSWGAEPARLDQLTRVHTLRARVSAVQWIRDTIDALQAVHTLPASLRQTVDAKAELAAFVLETHPLRSTNPLAEDVCRLLNAGYSPEWRQSPERPIKTVGDWIRELRGLFDGLQRVNEEDVRTRLLTGLDELPKPAPDADDETAPRIEGGVRELLDVLEQEDEFRGLVRLTRNLMAVMHLPRAIQESDDLSLGGVSDISNRGPLDRLLLSELAHDDDTLMVRVALNEALYLRRERPPAMPPREIAVLLDSGLRMWGVPRVYATAVALSLAATTDQTTDVRVFRADGHDVATVDLMTRDGLVAHLAALDARVHPGESLSAFARKLDNVDCDVVLVTGEDVLADRDFRRQLAECELPCTYLAALGRDGSYRMIIRSERGERTVREAVFSLTELFADRKQPTTPLIDDSVDPRLPAILRLRRFPLRLSHHLDRRNRVVFPSNVDGKPASLFVTRDRRLMLWDMRGLGARQLAERLPARHLLWSHVDDEIVRCVIGHPDLTSLHLLLLERLTLRCRVKPLATERRGGKAIFDHGGALFVVRRKSIEMFDPSHGELLATQGLPLPSSWRCGRFFEAPDGWYALSSNGLEPVMELVVPRDQIMPSSIAGVFDSDAAGGPLVVLRDGSLLDPTKKEVQTVAHELELPLKLTGVAQDGSAYAISSLARWSDRRPQECLVTLKPQLTVRKVWNAAACLSTSGSAAVHTRSLRVRVECVAGNHMGLWLVTRDGRWLILTLEAEADNFRWTPSKATHKRRTARCIQSRQSGGFELRSVQWEDGSRAILDSRGLLHLQSSDPNIPDATLVLSDDEAAGWCADGRMWGSDYFLGDQQRTSPTLIRKTVITPFLQRLR